MQDRIWIVKSNSRILGPFNYDEVATQLREKRLVPHDEIVAPRGRWKMIRQEEAFRTILNEIKNKQSARMDKTSEITTSASITVTESTTEVVDNFQVAAAEVENASSRDAVKSYNTKEEIRKDTGRRFEHTKILVALVVFAVAGSFAFFKMSKPESVAGRGDSFQQSLTNGMRAEKVGDFAKAMIFYSEARNLRPNDNQLLYHLAPLTLVFEKQSVSAGRMFKQLLDSDSSPDTKKLALMGLGLVALDSHELEQAQDNFSKVLAQDPQNTAALFNIGMVNYYRDNFEDAESYVSKALEKNGSDGTVVVSMAQITLANGQESKVHSRLASIHDLMRAYLESTNAYKAQVLIQDAYVLSKMGKTGEAQKELESLLDSDPDGPDLFFADWQIYRGLSSWDQSFETAKRTIANLESTPHMLAVAGFAHYQGREKLEGSQDIEKALSQDPKDPLLMALAGWVEMKLGKRDSGVTNIKEAALLNTKYKLPKILKARLCMEDKDYECAQKLWEDLLKNDQRCLEAYHGLAEIALTRKDTAGATRWLRQGQAMDPNYIPFLILNGEMEAASPEGI